MESQSFGGCCLGPLGAVQRSHHIPLRRETCSGNIFYRETKFLTRGYTNGNFVDEEEMYVKKIDGTTRFKFDSRFKIEEKLSLFGTRRFIPFTRKLRNFVKLENFYRNICSRSTQSKGQGTGLRSSRTVSTKANRIDSIDELLDRVFSTNRPYYEHNRAGWFARAKLNVGYN